MNEKGKNIKMKIKILLLIISTSTMASEPKFKYGDYVKVRKESCDDECSFYRHDTVSVLKSISQYNEVAKAALVRLDYIEKPKAIVKREKLNNGNRNLLYYQQIKGMIQ